LSYTLQPGRCYTLELKNHSHPSTEAKTHKIFKMPRMSKDYSRIKVLGFILKLYFLGGQSQDNWSFLSLEVHGVKNLKYKCFCLIFRLSNVKQGFSL
jgi:hypothetical protein